jgi:HSP20 family protein
MTTLVRKNQGWLPSVFNDLFEHPLFAQRMLINSPAINVKERKDEYVVEVAAPGMTKDDFDVRIDEDDYLIITLEKREECEEKAPKEECKCDDKEQECKCEERYLRREFSFSKYQQTMILPEMLIKTKLKRR